MKNHQGKSSSRKPTPLRSKACICFQLEDHNLRNELPEDFPPRKMLSAGSLTNAPQFEEENHLNQTIIFRFQLWINPGVYSILPGRPRKSTAWGIRTSLRGELKKISRFWGGGILRRRFAEMGYIVTPLHTICIVCLMHVTWRYSECIWVLGFLQS